MCRMSCRCFLLLSYYRLFVPFGLSLRLLESPCYYNFFSLLSIPFLSLRLEAAFIPLHLLLVSSPYPVPSLFQLFCSAPPNIPPPRRRTLLAINGTHVDDSHGSRRVRFSNVFNFDLPRKGRRRAKVRQPTGTSTPRSALTHQTH